MYYANFEEALTTISMLRTLRKQRHNPNIKNKLESSNGPL